jgi:hypothetical protein
VLSIAEEFDPQAGLLTTARSHHTASKLLSGEVLIVGGHTGSSPLSSAELYVP